jgi:hypothetical protein
VSLENGAAWRLAARQLLDLGGELAHASLELLVGVLQPVDLVTERSVLAFQPPKLLVQLARAADPRIAPSVPQPPRHRARTLRHDRCYQPPANAIPPKMGRHRGNRAGAQDR